MTRETQFLALTEALLGGATRIRKMMLSIAILAVSAIPALAVCTPADQSGCVKVDDPAIFELEANANLQNDAASAGPDWDSASPNKHKGETGNVTTFTQGGSKDINGISKWRWNNASVPDKDDIQNAYAYAATLNDQLLVYFAADRSSNNGDANMGVWFLQDNVSTKTDGTFTGHHKNGDIFVVSAFSSGGQTSSITIYKWSCGLNTGQACDDSGTLVSSLTGQQCAGTVGGTLTACATSNTSPTLAIDPYTPKVSGGVAGTYPIATFFEGGVNLGSLGISTDTCFASFLIETRSSTSTSAQLEDFMVNGFESCGISITKSCVGTPSVNSGGGSIHYSYSGTITNDGSGTLYQVTLVDSLPSGASNVLYTVDGVGPSGTVPVVASLISHASVNWSVTFDLASAQADNSAIVKASTTDVAPGTCDVTDGTVCSLSSGVASCSASPSNSITISKSCGIPATYPNATKQGTELVDAGAYVEVKVNFSGQISNTGQTSLSGITATDYPNTTITYGTWPGGVSGTLAPGASVKYSGTYTPDSISSGDGTGAGRYAFHDDIKVTGATAAFGSSPPADGTCTGVVAGAQACAAVTCNICPGSPSGLCSGN